MGCHYVACFGDLLTLCPLNKALASSVTGSAK